MAVGIQVNCAQAGEDESSDLWAGVDVLSVLRLFVG